MNYYKIHFLKRSILSKYPDVSAIEQDFVMESLSSPNEEKLEDWFFANVGNAQQYKVTIKTEQISEQDFYLIAKHNRIEI